MGMFDDEEKKMADEAAADARREEQQKAELRQVARKVGDDLVSYMGNHPRPQSIDISVHDNMVSLRKKTTSNALDIKCTGRNSFEVAIDEKFATGGNQSDMVRGVFDWLKR
jgi:hypothetical protein